MLSRLVEPINGPYIVNKMNIINVISISISVIVTTLLLKVGIIESKEVQCQRRHQRVYKKSIVS